ncbi:hypothetical protein H634G_10671 [Metarhizium anisopliae BRIP 53293]|uniref:BZIP domain-containing protein n=1 Tax=Metarhizium anisopliae BRIP 53293 TaxID=1291518 RepID=A0A0D9NN77_METAN|nr:hypothetical protein H634G_10671 [Metarhizium anisopliae BRIP 53293]KJK89207.1 hypothetical protein H633G_06931 [Metarhizium anisopliae BRIP 53284]
MTTSEDAYYFVPGLRSLDPLAPEIDLDSHTWVRAMEINDTDLTFEVPEIASLLDQPSKTSATPYHIYPSLQLEADLDKVMALPADASETKSPSPRQKDKSVKLHDTRSMLARPKQRPPPKATPSPPKRQRQTKQAATKGMGSGINGDAEPTTHRERSLERNRVAASNCRKRKKKWVDELEKRNSRLEKRHKDLKTEYLFLVQEISGLKNYIVGHASCHDPNIDIWLESEASKYVCKLQSEGPWRIRGLGFPPSPDAMSSSTPSWGNSQYTEPPNGSSTESEDSNSSSDPYDPNWDNEKMVSF